ncbi:hypothetical protein AGR6A_Lc120111 [Agrobacterium sp. NCPPB 925]|nr:hypothetical protein AGR6A_Lc120111 [Agrobacterium sp. NCPPB 925]
MVKGLEVGCDASISGKWKPGSA